MSSTPTNQVGGASDRHGENAIVDGNAAVIDSTSSFLVQDVMDVTEKSNPLLSSPHSHSKEEIVIVKMTDFSPSLQDSAIRIAKQTFSHASSLSLREMAKKIKEHFDSLFGLTWHCIIGKNFGSYVSHGI